MRRMVVLMVVVAFVAMSLSPAVAKMIRIGKLKSGTTVFVSDGKVVKKDGCKIVGTLFLMPKAKKTRHGMVNAIIRPMKICCKANTFSALGVMYVSPEKKVLYKRKFVRTKAITPKPGTLGQKLINMVCAKNFGK